MDGQSALRERRLANEQQTFARPLASLLRRQPVVCDASASIAAAAAVMREHHVGAVVVLDARGAPAGIFTERDLLGAIERDLGRVCVSEVMTRDPIALPGHALAYEAALAMIENRIRHLLVTEEGRLAGVISERDLFALQRLGLGELTMEIRLAGDVGLLARLAGEIRRLAGLLIDEGVAAHGITLFISVLNDRLAQRLIEVVRKRHHWERIAWCWLAFGSEGRLEQTFSTDQDNGIVFVSHGGASPDEVRGLLLPFAREVNEALDACGFPLCKGNVMASNPELCLTLEEWKAKMGGWLENANPQALLDASIYFDFRPLYGDATLATQLRDWMLERTRAQPVFLRLMAGNALQSRPALGLLGDFATENLPEAPHTISLKSGGVRPIVDAARICALGRGLPQTSTAERLRAAGAASGVPLAETEAFVAAFFFIQELRLRGQRGGKGAPDAMNRIDPSQLHEFDRRMLKEALRQARKLQQRLALDYNL